MAQLLGAIATMMEKATRPAAPPVDRTMPQPPLSPDNLDELVKQAKEFYKMEKPADFNVAVLGAQGCGKSSLINGLCNRSDNQPGAATVGESNNEPKPYRSLLLDALVFWEMPGARVGHPSATFYVDKKLYAFELLILVSDRFQRIDFEVAKFASHLNRPRFIFVRTKADLVTKQIVERESTNGPTIQVHEAFKILRNEVQASFHEGLRICGLSDKASSMTLFLVSTKRYIGGPSVYTVTDSHNSHQDVDEDEDDEEGHKLDEDNLVYHLTSIVRSRAVRRTRTFARRSQANINAAS